MWRVSIKLHLRTLKWEFHTVSTCRRRLLSFNFGTTEKHEHHSQFTGDTKTDSSSGPPRGFHLGRQSLLADPVPTGHGWRLPRAWSLTGGGPATSFLGQRLLGGTPTLCRHWEKSSWLGGHTRPAASLPRGRPPFCALIRVSTLTPSLRALPQCSPLLLTARVEGRLASVSAVVSPFDFPLRVFLPESTASGWLLISPKSRK